tara:strand:+ start:52 stop:642 length:591 start_codon:yes stop_codon:yes gene_type:complete
MSDELGSVMMDGEEELVMPTIPIRPNNAIPVAIGILVILGSLGGAMLSLAYSFSNSIDDDMREQAGYNDEMNATLDMLQDSGMAQTLTIMYGTMSLTLMIGGILLIRKNPLGVRFSTVGSVIFVLAIIVQLIWSYRISADYGIEYSIGMDIVCFLVCGAFCIALPLLTVMIPEGRAALYREPVILDHSNNEFGEEE